MPVHFHFQKQVDLKLRKKLKAFIPEIFIFNRKLGGNISFVFCSDEYLLNINKDFLQHDYYTDIITFNLSPKGQATIDAELYISVDRVKDNAFNLKIPLQVELQRVIFHGILHLCGFKDKSKSDILEMRKKEDECLKKFDSFI
ncbi:MAG: rRNA maturation RNase YbeY [Bacteroidetes bacterium]|nr:rRNA maturation RNase YbeY [Bacteroidota bacterium]